MVAQSKPLNPHNFPVCQRKMRFHSLIAAAVAILPSVFSTDAFVPKAFVPRKYGSGTFVSSTVAEVAEVMTSPIAGMKPGTSGLRKKVEVWQGTDETNKYYVQNFIQSLIDTAADNNGGKMIET